MKILNFVLLVGLAASTLAASFGASAKEITSVSDAREMTNTSDLPELKLGLTSSEESQLKAIPFRFFSSIEMKRRFQSVIAQLVLDERLGAPLEFDPGKSAYEHRVMMQGYRKSVCDKALQSMTVIDSKSHQALHGDAAFIDQMQGLSPRVLHADENDIKKISPVLEEKLIGRINAQISAASVQLKTENPAKVLGPLTGVDSFGGEHFRLHFKNLQAEVSLPMLISFMTQQDAGFVRTLECASRRLETLMADRNMHDKYWGMAPVRLAQTLKEKGAEALKANQLMSALSGSQLRAIIDTLVQLDKAAIMTPEEFRKQESAIVAKTTAKELPATKAGQKKLEDENNAAVARLEFLQFLNRELGDYRDTKRSVNLLRLEAKH